MFLKGTFIFLKIDLFWPELDLSLCQMWKWMSPSNFTCKMTHKLCVTRHSCYIFIWWPHLTWPWLVPCISLLFTWHLRHLFSSIFSLLNKGKCWAKVGSNDKADSFRLIGRRDKTRDSRKSKLRNDIRHPVLWLQFALEGQMPGQRLWMCQLPREASFRLRPFWYARWRNFGTMYPTFHPLSFNWTFKMAFEIVLKVIFVFSVQNLILEGGLAEI